MWQARKMNGSSQVWQSLLHGRDFLNKNSRWVLARESPFPIRDTTWLATSQKISMKEDSEVERVGDLMVLGQVVWDPQKLRDSVSPHQAMDVLQTPIGWNTREYVLFWPEARDGCYKVKLGYGTIARNPSSPPSRGPSSYSGNDTGIWPMIWKATIPEKIKIILWKACHNVFPVRCNLTQKRIAISIICPICHREPETIEHTMLLCHWTTPVGLVQVLSQILILTLLQDQINGA